MIIVVVVSAYWFRYFFTLKAHWQVSKKSRFEKYCLCDKACQFSAF